MTAMASGSADATDPAALAAFAPAAPGARRVAFERGARDRERGATRDGDRSPAAAVASRGACLAVAFGAFEARAPLRRGLRCRRGRRRSCRR
jgi:hypothetical protein